MTMLFARKSDWLQHTSSLAVHVGNAVHHNAIDQQRPRVRYAELAVALKVVDVSNLARNRDSLYATPSWR